MCPLCLTTAALVLVGSGAAGGLGACLLRRSARGQRRETPNDTMEKQT